MGENNFEPVPVATYGIVLLMAGISWYILKTCIIRFEGKDSKLLRATGRDLKGKISIVFYAAAIPLAFVDCWIALAIYILVALMWLVPDRRIERLQS